MITLLKGHESEKVRAQSQNKKKKCYREGGSN